MIEPNTVVYVYYQWNGYHCSATVVGRGAVDGDGDCIYSAVDYYGRRVHVHAYHLFMTPYEVTLFATMRDLERVR